MVSTQNQCPKWAEQMILQIATLEIRLGNITGKAAMHGADLESLLQKVADDFGSVDKDAVDNLFLAVSLGLTKEGFSPEAIADLINARVGSEMRLPYCDASEVRDALAR